LKDSAQASVPNWLRKLDLTRVKDEEGAYYLKGIYVKDDFYTATVEYSIQTVANSIVNYLEKYLTKEGYSAVKVELHD